MIHVATEGQDIFDVVIQRFGQIDNIFDLLADNPSLSINSRLSSGDELTINNEEKGELRIKTLIQNINFVVMNADEEALATLGGDYNDDYNDDFLNT